VRWYYWPIAIWGSSTAFICAAAGWVARRDKGTPDRPDTVNAVLDRTTPAVWGWDGAAIEDHFADTTKGIVI
jgi:hypothetical protein